MRRVILCGGVAAVVWLLLIQLRNGDLSPASFWILGMTATLELTIAGYMLGAFALWRDDPRRLALEAAREEARQDSLRKRRKQ